MKKLPALSFFILVLITMMMIVPSSGAYTLATDGPYFSEASSEFYPFTNAFGDELGNLTTGTYWGTFETQPNEYGAILANEFGLTTYDISGELNIEAYLGSGAGTAGTWATFSGLGLSNTNPITVDTSTISWDTASDLFVDILIVKAGNYAAFFSSEFASTYGTWNTAFLPSGGSSANPIEISHVRGVIGTAPVPEPGTIVLMGIGLVGLAGAGRKRLLKK